jgi:hypothetical protein
LTFRIDAWEQVFQRPAGPKEGIGHGVKRRATVESIAEHLTSSRTIGPAGAPKEQPDGFG